MFHDVILPLLKREVQIFGTALTFYTRLPCRTTKLSDSAAYLDKASKYFPLIGWLVGGSAATVWWLSHYWLSSSLAIGLSMVSSILLTGAFHEDGFADFCDGFGGGWTAEQILTIMKDSCVGSYGVIGVVMILQIKFLALVAIPVDSIAYILVVGHSLSRFTAITFLVTHEYVRANEDSKVKAVAKKLSLSDLFMGGIFAALPLWLLPSFYCLLVLIPMLLTKIYLGQLFSRKIGGYTGDCLGATQQLTEVIFYLTMATEFWTFI
jgi:adenosylcobinamide-GDP ribazoletransferase